jgi:hypothetical protein
MVDTLALPKLYTDVKARFSAESTTANVVFGWREPAKQINQGPGRANRICIVPGDESGDIGEITSARNPGRNPRPLATLNEVFSVYVFGWDSSAPEDELKQYIATRFLYDAWYRAVYLAAHGTFQVLSAKWVTTQMERRFGAEILAVYAIESMIPDSPWTIAPPPIVSDIDNSIVLQGGNDLACVS